MNSQQIKEATETARTIYNGVSDETWINIMPEKSVLPLPDIGDKESAPIETRGGYRLAYFPDRDTLFIGLQ